MVTLCIAQLNETGHKLLFRDRKLKVTKLLVLCSVIPSLQLYLYDIETETLTPLLPYCSFVQVYNTVILNS